VILLSTTLTYGDVYLCIYVVVLTCRCKRLNFFCIINDHVKSQTILYSRTVGRPIHKNITRNIMLLAIPNLVTKSKWEKSFTHSHSLTQLSSTNHLLESEWQTRGKNLKLICIPMFKVTVFFEKFQRYYNLIIQLSDCSIHRRQF